MISLFGTFFFRFYFVCVLAVLNEGFRCVYLISCFYIDGFFREQKQERKNSEFVHRDVSPL